MLDHTTVYPGVRDALEELRGRKLTVLTNKPVNFSREMLKRLGLAHLFSFVYGGNSFPQKKPDPVGVRKLMSDSGVSAQQALLVGDSDTDVLTGRNAGVWTCGVTYGFAPHTLEETPPDFVLGDLRDLPLLLDGRMTAGQESGTKDQG
jgi:phosphoglycolate phosphatase